MNVFNIQAFVSQAMGPIYNIVIIFLGVLTCQYELFNNNCL